MYDRHQRRLGLPCQALLQRHGALGGQPFGELVGQGFPFSGSAPFGIVVVPVGTGDVGLLSLGASAPSIGCTASSGLMNPRSTRAPSELKETIAPARDRSSGRYVSERRWMDSDLTGQAVELRHNIIGSILAVLGDERIVPGNELIELRGRLSERGTECG